MPTIPKIRAMADRLENANKASEGMFDHQLTIFGDAAAMLRQIADEREAAAMEMTEYHRHVASDASSKVALCGHKIEMTDWVFMDAEHAIATVHSGSRLLPCMACAKAGGGELLECAEAEL